LPQNSANIKKNPSCAVWLLSAEQLLCRLSQGAINPQNYELEAPSFDLLASMPRYPGSTAYNNILAIVLRVKDPKALRRFSPAQPSIMTAI
jgi:hypothetical protein